MVSNIGELKVSHAATGFSAAHKTLKPHEAALKTGQFPAMKNRENTGNRAFCVLQKHVDASDIVAVFEAKT